MHDPLSFDFNNQELDTQGQQARWAADKRLVVRFYRRPVLNQVKTAEQGRQIYDEKDYIFIQTPGDRLSNVDAPVNDEYKIRFRDQWERYQKQQAEPESGTPVSMAPWISPGLCLELKSMGINTVEALAELSDTFVMKIMGGHELKRKATAFLSSAEAAAEQSRLEAELAKRDNELDLLKKQMAELAASVKKAEAAKVTK